MIRNVHRWLWDYALDGLSRRSGLAEGKTVDLLFCVADHFEPLWENPPEAVGDRRVSVWLESFPKLAARHRDFDGRGQVHTFFFPAEQYRPQWIDALAQLTKGGFGEVEIHLHHGHDTPDNLRTKISEFRDRLADRGLLSSERGSKEVRYGFVHGDWALANSGVGPEECGVEGELDVLVQTGCYADFTFPSAPSPTQIPTVNRIFFVEPRAKRPRPHARGVDAGVGGFRPNDFLLIEGPLGLDWTRRKFGLLPRIENGELSGGNPPDSRRVPLWLRRFVHVAGRPEWQFIKLHTHGAAERNRDPLLGEAMDSLLTHLESEYNDGKRFRLHYVSAREMYNVARAAMDGCEGNPGEYRDYVLLPRWRNPA